MTKNKRNNLEIAPNGVSDREDKRLFCRFVLKDAPLRFKDLKIGEKGEAICKDISGSGMAVESKHEIKPKTPLELWVDLPDGHEALHMVGKVVWSNLLGANWRVGIAFDKPKLMGLSRILKVEDAEQ